MPFDEQVRTRVLLWCDRHCCLCKKACGVNIEVDHIIPRSEGGIDDIGNAIPLCFECHSEAHRYNPAHPKGTKFKPDELRARREQVYEEFTRHLVPPVHWEITQVLPTGGSRQFPDAGFVLSHVGDSLPVHVSVLLRRLQTTGAPVEVGGHYDGSKLWRLNPRFSVWGHFPVPASSTEQRVHLEVQVTITDQYERKHSLLPLGYIYAPEGNSWYVEP
jgi:hypothetical protein